jgi:hypothetical protein
MQGYNGSQLWDTAFTVQAYAATGLLSASAESLAKAHEYLKHSQVVTESEQPLGRYYRHISAGAWPFSTRDHGWPISDCTSEVLSCPRSLWCSFVWPFWPTMEQSFCMCQLCLLGRSPTTPGPRQRSARKSKRTTTCRLYKCRLHPCLLPKGTTALI